MKSLYPLTPNFLNWLSSGQLGNKFQRTFRMWWLIEYIYQDSEENFSFNQPFSYAQLRKKLFSAVHPNQEYFNNTKIKVNCQDKTCLCQQSIINLVSEKYNNLFDFEIKKQLQRYTGFDLDTLELQLESCPFATVHRSLRDDLKQLLKLEFLTSPKPGYYQRKPLNQLPQFQQYNQSLLSSLSLSLSQIWQLLNILESVAFIEPDLEILIDDIWQSLTENNDNYSSFNQNQYQRIFIHLDYVLSPEIQEQIDNYQQQIEQIWQEGKNSIIKFNYWCINKHNSERSLERKKVTVIVYPVCFHYIKRAKYLSAYGLDPSGNINWHNYRLDRICSRKIQSLVWGDPSIPKILKDQWLKGELPNSEDIKDALDEAWGFNFYQPKALLIIRFSADFERWYVENTARHPTFKKVPFANLFNLVKSQIVSVSEQKQILAILKAKSPDDIYYQAWIRLGDINLIMRLRDWRPNGEVIAPISIREILKQEALQELSNYQF